MTQAKPPPDWAPPPCFPNRFGDRRSDSLYAAVGRALTMWDYVETSLMVAARACVPFSEEWDRIEDDFATAHRVADRSKMARRLIEACVSRHPPNVASNIRSLSEQLLGEYRGWADRRNEIAHGCLTPSRSPDYSHPDAKIVTNYTWTPSHSNIRRWSAITHEPNYNYVAKDIRTFARGFYNLHKRLDVFAGIMSDLALSTKNNA